MDQNSLTLVRWAFVLITTALFSASAWAAGSKVAFDIPAGPAQQALHEFYVQSQVRVLYLTAAVKGVETQAVTGELEASEALERLLQGTGLSFQFDGEDSAIIALAPAASPAHQATSGSASGAGPRVPLAPNTGNQTNLQEVLVTGSFIHGVFNITSPLIQLDKEEIKGTSYATVQDVVQALPLAATVTRGEVVGGVGNFGRGTGINLRGLGEGATLVLVNGRRQPAAGIRGDFVDVSNIPWSMIERIEVLPDGGSALYGSDAIAGVVNILLRHDLEGAESQLRYGTARDGAEELLASQMIGHHWDSGHWLAGYQYYERTSLAAADRDYAANADKRQLGGRDYRSVSSSPGNVLDPQTLQPVFAIPHGQDGTSLDPSDLVPGAVNYRNQFAHGELLPDKHTHSVYFTASQNLNEHLELFGEGRYGQRDIRLEPMLPDGGGQQIVVPATNPFFVDPFGGAPFVIVAYDLANELGPLRVSGRTRSYLGTLGLKSEFDGSWRAALSASYGAEDLRSSTYGEVDPDVLAAALADPDPATAFNPFGDGSHTNPATIEAIQAANSRYAKSELSSILFTADGPLLDLPSGAIKAGIGAEYREERLSQDSRTKGLDQLPSRVQFGRSIAAVFAELSVPLIGDPGDPLAPPRFELSLAGRYERYDDFGRTYNPKIGLRWTPLTSLKLRASWGTSFKAPSLVDLDDARNASTIVSFGDPRSPAGRSDVLALVGGNPDLSEERATTWTAGLDLAPPALPGLQVSLTAYSIDYEDQVIQPGPLYVFEILHEEDQWAPVITRNPSQSQIDAICSSPRFFGDASQCRATPPTVFIDLRQHNLAITKVKGVDLTLNQSFETDVGHFNFHVNGTHVFHFKRALTKSAPVIDVVDSVNSPLALRLRGTVEWRQRGAPEPGFAGYLTTNFTGGYEDGDSPVRHSVDAWTTFDFGLSYRTGTRGSWMDGIEFSLHVGNVANEDPPFVDREWGYDFFNAQPIGRVISAYVSRKW